MFTLLLLFFAQASSAPVPKPAAEPLAALTVYAGEWTISSTRSMAGPGKDDHLVNHCLMADAFYACEQVVNGKPVAMIVFTPGDSPNTFHTQIVLPDGHALGRGDLVMDGNHWTFGRKEAPADPKETRYRTRTTSLDATKIHFDQYESADGTTWKLTNSGDEHRGFSAPGPSSAVPGAGP